MIKQITLVILCSFVFISAFSQTPKYSNEFLAIGVSAKALGMSNSCIASVNDVTAGYWNPAGLLLTPSDRQLVLMHSEYFAGIAKYDYGALSANIDDKSSLGVSFIRFAVDDIPNTTELIDNEGNINYNRIKTFSAADYAVLLSYARKSKIEGLRYGINVKIINRKVGDFASAWGFGLDIGLQYDKDKWKFGLMAKDITTTFNVWNYDLDERTKEVFTKTGNDIPENSLELTMPRLILGAAKEFEITDNFSALFELNLDITTDGKRNVLIKSDPFSIDPHLGMEIGFKKFIFLRAGIGNIQEETDVKGKKITSFQPNIGLGIVIKKSFSIDYALTDLGDNSIALYSNVFSLKLNINKKTN